MANLSWISSNPDYINQMIRNTQVTLSNNYNDLDNIPIIKITSTTNNPQKIWELKEGLYMIDGVVQVDNNTSYEVSNLLISMTARLENGKYVLSAFIPYLRGLFEYILKTNSTEYEQHQKIVLMIKNDTLALDNETIYTPIEDYHPATKKYVDDKANEIVTELDRMGVNKENLESLNKENRIRDIKLQALLSETSDRNITIEENVRYFDMPLSIDNGIVTINEIVGETLVNVCDQEESVAITKSYTVENENHIPLQGEYDGSCRPIVHGNTLVNHNADWDGNLQTGIETSASGIEDVQVEGIKGQEVSVVVEGNTVLNHALGKTSAVVSSIESENEGNYVDLTVANDMSSVVEIEGRTMVNVCDQKEPIAITKSYTVENSGNHIALQGEYDGNCRPVIQGNTLVNLAPKYTINWTHDGTWQSLFLMGTQANATVKILQDLKPATTYTIIINITKNTQSGYTLLNNYHEGTSVFLTHMRIDPEDLGIKTFVVTTRDSFDTLDPTTTVILRSQSSGIASGETVIEDIMLFEGDLTQTPELIPTEYVEGLKSSFEDGLIPENLTTNIQPTLNNISTAVQYRWDNKSAEGGITVCTVYTTEDKISLPYRRKGIVEWVENEVVDKGISVHVAPEGMEFYCIQKEYDEKLTNPEPFQAIVLEGDWTHLTEEDFNNLGKYKVEYKVTGKNKFNEDNICYVGQIYSDAGLLYNNENYNVGGYIECNKKQYILSGTTTDGSNYNGDYIVEFNENKEFIKRTYMTNGLINLSDTTKYISVCPYITSKNIQIEEGLTMTSYEPYKEYTKTFYLNSPLLEGDTIEDVNGVATHVKRYGKVVLDGSENWRQGNFNNTNTMSFDTDNNFINVYKGNGYCDRFINNTSYKDTHDFEYFANISNNRFTININKTKLSITDVNGFKQWLQANPTTVVYELASPIYEPISTESILCDSYANGHLDFDSAVPIEKVEFKNLADLHLKYLQPNTDYTVQLESDNIGIINWVAMGNNSIPLRNIDITKGINRVKFTTEAGLTNNLLKLNGIGFNASNIVVTEAIDTDFEYFGGLSSTYESCYPGGKNLFNKNNIERIRFATGTNIEVGEEAIIRALSGQHQFAILELPKGTYTWSIPGGTYFPSGWSMAVYECDTKSISVGTTLKQIGKIYFIGNATKITFTCQKKYQFVQLAYMQDDLTDETILGAIQIEEGSTATSYEPFIDKYKIDVKVIGKNILHFNNYTIGALNTNGSIQSNNQSFRTSDYIKVKPNTNYIRSGFSKHIKDNIVKRTYAFYDINKNCIGWGNLDSIITPDNCYYIRVGMSIEDQYFDGILTVYKDNIDSLQIEEGTQATSYEPYFESTKTFYLNSPLLEGDKIVTKNGKVYHYHKMGMVVLDGSEDWWSSSNANGITFMSTTSLFNLGTSDRKILCDSLRVNQGINQETLTDYNEILAHKSSSYSNACYISTQLSQSDFINWLKSNPITVVYELDTPYYELIDEYNNTILNIPKNVAHLTHTSAVPVNNTVFTNYKDELNVLEANTQYRLMFDCDTANIPFTITLGGTSQEVTSKKGTHSLLITTPSTLVDKNLVIDGIGRCGIDNIRIFKGKVEYDYVKGLWSGYEERKLENLTDITEVAVYSNGSTVADWMAIPIKNLPNYKVYTIICDKTKKTGLTIYNSVGDGILAISSINDESHVISKFKKYSNAYASIGVLTNDKNKGVSHSVYNILILEGDWTDNPPTYEEVMANEGKYAVKVKLDTNATIFGKGGRL